MPVARLENPPSASPGALAYPDGMARYFSEADAEADGYTIVHAPDQHGFVILYEGRVLGEAHYTLLGDAAIDFDHTEVDPSLRGSGLSAVLAHRALTDEIVRGRRIRTSCWFMDGYLSKHPELAETGESPGA